MTRRRAVTVCFCEGARLEARRQKTLTSLEEVQWTQARHRFEEDVRNLELRAPREEAPARNEASTVVKTRQCQSEGSSGHNNRRTHRDQVLR